MTDKEQIIIDGVDVSKCKHFHKTCAPFYSGGHSYFNVCRRDVFSSCESNPNCTFKQLARKTQECEELKEKCEELKEDRYNLNMEMYVFNRYRKALEKIEGLVKNFCKDCSDYEDCNWDKEGCYYSLIPNLKDIINKVKG